MDEKVYEAICDVCSQPFTTNDEDAAICPACWKEIVGDNEGEGTDEAAE